MIDAAVKSNTSVLGIAHDCGIAPWSWHGWQASYKGGGVQLLLDGFIGLDGGKVETRRSSIEPGWAASIIDLYKRKGSEFIQSLRGSFALVLWDSHQQKLILATDHFGTRPIYYWLGGDRIAFAPRIHPFVGAPEIPTVVEPNSLYFYLNHSFIPAPFTIYKSVKRLEPGHTLEWINRRSTMKRYWDITYDEDRSLSEISAANILRSSLQESVGFAVQNGSTTCDKIGAFLSGGTDSSTLVGLMSRISGNAIDSFSVGFEEESYNEIHYARIAAQHFRSVAHEHFVRPEEALDAITTLAEAYDEPFGNSSAIPTYFCLKMARDAGVKVMFAGDGGDELFGGNERYITEKMFSIYQQVPRFIRAIVDSSAEIVPSFYPWRKVKNYVRKANQPAIDRFFAYQLYFRDHAAEYLTDDFRASLDYDFPIDVARRHYQRVGEVHPLNRLLYVDLKLAVADNDLFKVNRMAESHGIQVRYPFLDPHVGIASGKIPASLKVKGWSKRYIFKKAFANFLPQEILSKKKHGFGLPTGDWLRGHSGFRDLARSLLLDSRSVQRGYFQRVALEELLKTHDQEQSGYFGAHIWNFMMLELWHRTHADRCCPNSL